MYWKILLARVATWFVRLFWGFLMRLRYSSKSVPPVTDSVLLLPAIELAKKINAGELTSVRVVRAYIERIGQVNGLVNAVVEECFDEAVQAAKQVDEQLSALRASGNTAQLAELLRSKPFFGVPVSIKHTFAVKGKRWTGGIWAFRNRKAQRTNNEVQRILDSGAIITCLTNIPEMAMWLESHNPVFGLTRNPYDLSRIAGGSSGGEGSLIGAAGSVMGIGSDIAGSLRIPAQICGVFAHKPSPGLDFDPDYYGHCPSTINTKQRWMCVYGPMCRYASDLWPFLNTILSSSGKSKLRTIQPSEVDFKRTKFLYYKQIAGDSSVPFFSSDEYVLPPDSTQLEALDRVLHYLKNDLKADVSALQLDKQFDDLRAVELLAIATAYMFTPDNVDAPQSEWRTTAGKPWPDTMTSLSGTEPSERHSLRSEVIKKVLSGFGMLFPTRHSWAVLWLANLERQFIGLPLSVKKALIERGARFEKAFDTLFAKYKQKYDNVIILGPVWPTTPYHHETIITETLEVLYTEACNVLGLPSTVAPVFKDKTNNLPGCVQIITARYDDAVSIAFAQHLESVFGGWKPPA